MTRAERSARVRLGVDLGSTGPRVAYGLPGEPPRTLRPRPEAPHEVPWLLCERPVTGRGPFAFPSLKRRLGSPLPVVTADGERSAEELVAAELRRVREQVEAAAGGAVAHTVFTVPVSYGSAQRTALRAAAEAAGLAAPRLISDGVAAVIAHMDGQGSGTYLAFGVGYDGFELGLVRGARGQYRTLGVESAETSGGRTFDAAVLDTAYRHLRGGGGGGGMDEGAWRRLRRDAERAREWLGAAPGGFDAVAELRVGKAPFEIALRRSDLDAYLDRHVARILARARTLFEQTGTDPAGLDAVLLFGGATGMERIGAGAASLGRPCVRLAPDRLALGALAHAARLDEAHPAGPEESATAPWEPGHDTLGDLPPLTATLLPAPGRTRTPEGSTEGAEGQGGPEGTDGRDGPDGPDRRDRPDQVAEARRLAAAGRGEEAAELLRGLIEEAREAQEALDELSGPPARSAAAAATAAATAAARPSTAAARQLGMARTLLQQGHHDQAVQASHAAWREERTRPAGADVLEAMIEVHCSAAMAAGPGRFADAERWLQCAYNHDQTNGRIRELLAERTYQHAVELHDRGRRHDTAAALRKCLGWNPEHTGAQALLGNLNFGRSRPRGST
ncbi:Hsp70 family protein [Streptomyces sp. NPDC048172]|uniref:Hsp70 family protein n=1 Tax=Streptomyces sp. NPDC048172 TaxID=3365505 RepID=UPI00372113C7